MTKGQKVTRFEIKSGAQNDTKDLRKENNEIQSDTELFSINSFHDIAILILMGYLTLGGGNTFLCTEQL